MSSESHNRRPLVPLKSVAGCAKSAAPRPGVMSHQVSKIEE